jgi:hypothetical protein
MRAPKKAPDRRGLERRKIFQRRNARPCVGWEGGFGRRGGSIGEGRASGHRELGWRGVGKGVWFTYGILGKDEDEMNGKVKKRENTYESDESGRESMAVATSLGLKRK